MHGIDFDRQAHLGGVDRLQQIGGDGRVPLDNVHQVFQGCIRVIGQVEHFVNDHGNGVQSVLLFSRCRKDYPFCQQSFFV